MVIKKSKSEIDADKLIQELANNSEKMTISAKLRLISRINKKLKKATTQPVDIDYSVLVWFSIFETRQFDYSDWRVFPFLNFSFLHSIDSIECGFPVKQNVFSLFFPCFFPGNNCLSHVAWIAQKLRFESFQKTAKINQN